MRYDDIIFIKSQLNKCIKIKYNNRIYYITSENITRQLKYNRIFTNNKSKINVDITKLNFVDNVILMQDFVNKYFYPNYNIWLYFENKYKQDVLIKNNIRYILCDLLNINNYFVPIYLTVNKNILLSHVIELNK